MRNTTRRLSVLSALIFVGCVGPSARSTPPPIDAMDTTSLGLVAHPGVVDAMRAESVWYDEDLDRLVRLEHGSVVEVQARAVAIELGGQPTAIRVFDDGSAVAVIGGTLVALPADGSAAVPIDTPSLPIVDGVSSDDFWAGGWALEPLPGTTGDYGACHVVHHAIETCVAFPNVGGYDGVMAVASDGAVYLTDREDGLYRWDGASLAAVPEITTSVTSFHHAGTALLADTYDAGLYRIDASGVQRLVDTRFVDQIAGSADDFFFTTYDGHDELVDPSCHSVLFSCPTQRAWSQLVVHHFVAGTVTDVGVEQCTLDGHEDACGYLTLGLGVDDGHAVLLGDPIRRTE